MSQLQINYKVVPTFARVHRDDNLYLFIRGPVGSGKSSGCIMHLFLNALMQHPDHNRVRNSRYAVIRSTYPALKSTVIKSWISWFKDRIKVTYDTPIRGVIRFGDLGDGTSLNMELLFIAVNDEQSVEKLRSLELTGAHCNEAAELTPELFEMLKTRVNRFPARKDGGAVNPQIVFDYNSVSTNHWLYELAEVERPEKHSFYSQPPAVKILDPKEDAGGREVATDSIGNRYVVNYDADNIDMTGETGVAPSYYLNQVFGGDPDFISVNLMNNYGEVRSGRPVYKDYEDREHLAEEEIKPLNGAPIIVGVDQGLTPAAVFVQQAPDGSLLVLDEITTEDCSLQEFCEEHLWPLIHRKYKKWKNEIVLVVDPATVQRSMNDAKAGTEIIKEAGFNYRTAKTNVATERREAVIYFLRRKGKFKLSPTCKVLRSGFISGYHYEEMRSAQSTMFKDKPAKNEYSHPHDALQYAVLEFYSKPRKRLANFKKTYRAASSVGGY